MNKLQNEEKQKIYESIGVKRGRNPGLTHYKGRETKLKVNGKEK